MSVRDFVSEKQLEDEKKRRQEEWDRVRQPGQAEEAPEPEDRRPLYDRLKQQRDQKQLDFDEAHKLKNMLRGLDSEEVGFLDYVDNMRREEELKRINEERALISEVKKHTADATSDPVDIVKISELTRKPIQASTSKTKERSKQAQLLAGAVKKRKAEEESGGPSDEKKAKTGDAADDEQDQSSKTEPLRQSYPSATVVAGVRLSATRSIGGGALPGLESYDESDSDDSSNSSSDAEDAAGWMMYTTPVQLRLERQQQQKAESASKE